MMTQTHEKDIIRTLVKAGNETLAKAFARSRGYRVRAAGFKPGDRVTPTDDWYDRSGGQAPLPPGAVGVVKKLAGRLVFVEFPEDKGKIRRLSSTTLRAAD